jgi:hypothetical protein
MATFDYKRQTPRARQEGLLHTPLNDELVIYDTERNKAHSLNRVASLVWKHCDGQTEVKQIQQIVAQELQTPVDEQVIWLALRQLEQNRLLEERMQAPINLISRREAAKRFSKIAGIVVPLVASAMIPPAVAAGSCLASGAPCTMSVQCCTGVCNGMGMCA